MADHFRTAGTRSIEVLSARPDLAVVTNKAKARIDDGTVCTVRVGEHTMILDLPRGTGGLDTGPTPSQTTAGALAACLAQTYSAKAAMIGAQLTGVEVKVEATSMPEGCTG